MSAADDREPTAGAHELVPRALDDPLGRRRGGAETALVVALTLVCAIGLVGVPTAILGIFEPLVVVPLAIAVWAELYLLSDPGLRARPAARSAPRRWWVAVLVLVAALTLSNARLAAEHVLADRDPGIYLNAAAWLASEGTLAFEPRVDGFDGVPIVGSRPGVLPTGEPGAYNFQFLDLLPVLQAAGAWVAGDLGLTRVPTLLAGLALMAFFALASSVVRPWLAAAATAALGLNLAFVSVARDAYSEPLTLALLAGGLWLALDAIDARSTRRMALAGVVLGCAAMARVDFPVYLIGLVAFLAIETVRLMHTELHAFWCRRALPALAAGLLPGLVLGVASGLLTSRGYVAAQAGVLLPLLALVALTAVAAATVVVAWQRLRPVRLVLRRHARPLAIAAGAGIVALALFALAIRPHLLVERDPALMAGMEATYAAFQAAEGVDDVVADRTFSERSLWWMAWYIGLPTLLAAVGGLAWVMRDLARGRAPRAEALLALVVLAPLVLALARPSAFPDHPWVMRRFVTLALPALIVFAMLLCDRALARARGRGPRARALRAGATAVAAATVAVPLATLLPVAGYHAYADFADPVRATCQRVGPDGAVAILPPLSESLALAFQTMCKVPAAGLRSAPSPRAARDLARRLDGGERRRLWLVGADAESLTASGAIPALRVRSAVGRRLQPTLTRRPGRLVAHEAGFVAGAVGNASSGSGFHGPEQRSATAPWRWLGARPWLTVVGEGPTWIGFQALAFRRPRTLTLRTPAGDAVSTRVTTAPRAYLVGPLDVRGREELEVLTTPGREAGPAGDSRLLSASITDPVVVDRPIAAFGSSGFWPAERDAAQRPFNWLKPRATVAIVARRATRGARLVIEASAPAGARALVVRAATGELARLRLRPGFRRYAVDGIRLVDGRATLVLVHAPGRVIAGDDRGVAIQVAGLDAIATDGRR